MVLQAEFRDTDNINYTSPNSSESHRELGNVRLFPSSTQSESLVTKHESANQNPLNKLF